tara:strand:+ start:1330 stop:1788 length:459 start_codon:yes stop_codon:yes gene_type:complete
MHRPATRRAAGTPQACIRSITSPSAWLTWRKPTVPTTPPQAALHLRRVFEDDEAIGYGFTDGEDLFCLKLRAAPPRRARASSLVFGAGTRAAVHPVHAAALAHGGRSPAALRPACGEHPAAFVIDPAGHTVEAVWKPAPPPGEIACSASVPQ